LQFFRELDRDLKPVHWDDEFIRQFLTWPLTVAARATCMGGGKSGRGVMPASGQIWPVAGAFNAVRSLPVRYKPVISLSVCLSDVKEVRRSHYGTLQGTRRLDILMTL